MPPLAQCRNGVAREVLVRQNTHWLRSRQWIDLFCSQGSAGIAQAGLHILVLQPWMVAQDLCLYPALSQEIDDELDSKKDALAVGVGDLLQLEGSLQGDGMVEAIAKVVWDTMHKLWACSLGLCFG
jgi:hypothetical protein